MTNNKLLQTHIKATTNCSTQVRRKPFQETDLHLDFNPSSCQLHQAFMFCITIKL